MKKYFVIIYCLSFTCVTYLFSEANIYDSLLNILSNNNPSAKVNFYSINILKENIKLERYKWLPKLGITTEQKVSGFLSNKKVRFSTTDLTLGVTQNLPLGGNLVLFNKHKISNAFNITPKEFSYGFTTGAKLEFPFLFIVPSIFSELKQYDLYSQKDEMEIINIEQQLFEVKLVSTTVQALGNYYLLKKNVKINEEYEKLLILAEKKDENLWIQGRLSSLELQDRSNKRTDKQNEMIKTMFQFETAKENLKLIGVYENYTIDDLDEWILLWEFFLDNFEINDLLIARLNKLRLHSDWNSQIQSYISYIPKFYISCDFTPNANKESYKSFSESVSETFKEKNQVTWNVNLGMTINLDPFAKEYSLNKQFKNLKEIQRINEEELNKKLNLQAIQIRNNLKMLDEQIKNANSKIEALKLRNLEAESMYSSGYISEVDCSLQKLELQEAELAYTSLRLSKIIYYLQFYNKKQL